MRNHPLERGYYAIHNHYADGGRTRVPKSLLNREEQEEQARQILEGLRGVVGAPSRESVMVPGAAEAYGVGELGGLLSEIPFSPMAMGKGALGAALAGAIRRGGDPSLLAVHNMKGDPENIVKLLSERRSISSPSVAISRNVSPYAVAPTLLFNPNSPLLDPAMNPANRLYNRDAYTFRDRLAPRDLRTGTERIDARFTEKSATPEKGQGFAIGVSPDFRSFAEYERNPYGKGVLGNFSHEDMSISNKIAQAASKWRRQHAAEIKSGQFGDELNLIALLNTAASQGDETAKNILTKARSLPSNYGELKVAGEIPIGPRDVSAVLFPQHQSTDDWFGGAVEAIGRTGVPVGTPKMFLPENRIQDYNRVVADIPKRMPEFVKTLDDEGYHGVFSPYKGVVSDTDLRNLVMSQSLFPDSASYANRIEEAVYGSSDLAAEVARSLTNKTRFAGGGLVKAGLMQGGLAQHHRRTLA